MSEIYLILIVLFLVVNIGYLLGYIQLLSIARIFGWLLVVSATLLVHIITYNSSPLFRMLAIITTTLFSMKGIVFVEVYRGRPKLTYLQWLGFAIGWFGMRPQLFEKLISPKLDGINVLFIKGLIRIGIGFLFLISAAFLNQNYDFHYYISGIIALVGMSFILHFGILVISAANWRLLGVDCKELFRSPALSMSLNEFWGKRWNLAFSEMTALVVYRPIKNKMNKGFAVFLSFVFSGVLHEVAISLPVNSGYGLPMIYFCIHGLLMFAEQRVIVVKQILEHTIYSRVWVLFWLILPMPLLFHKEFMGKIVFPLTNQLTVDLFGKKELVMQIVFGVI